MLRIGITGGIGSGKTTVCRVWERLGAHVIYADDLAKSLMVNDPELKQQLVEAFGEEVYLEDGSLDRHRLSVKAFGEGRVEELNRLVHPVVCREIDRIEEEARKEGTTIAVREAALLLDKGRPEVLDAVILVTAPEEERIRRVSKRDQSDEKQVRERMQRQKLESDMRPYADLVIENNGSRELLEEKADVIFRELEPLAGA
ncbi:dephospho-CoA kinase [Balneolales bacterium ANBcel1]|nr:dephospho-CoA kinase [Balneolales bacterium ANBcel1]